MVQTTDAITLEARDVRVHFEGVKAVDGVDLDLTSGEILGLIGPNGAGKSTLVNALSGFCAPTSGEVNMGGSRVTGWPPRRLSRHGLVRTFQAVRLFGRLSVLENVQAGAVAGGLSLRASRGRALELLRQFGLADRAGLDAVSLPLGEERLLGVARAMAARPRLLLLDEPAAGLNESEGDELRDALVRVRDDHDCGLMVIEHDMRFMMALCERIQVLDAGRTISIGTPQEVRTDPAVLTAYLGTAREASDAQG
ncbi:MAG: branched-chain amino acid transport system ATP-binding protein [Baekduia sp.]|jgi:branched-chain amino acid transport system ATP-binding protein|nr:branched-chain amino acid transport system ATP-binding protein [Baekduia sp.]